MLLSFDLYAQGLADIKNEFKITQFSFGAAKIELDSITIYVDLNAGNIDTANLKTYADADIILITHDDWDHFSAKWIAEISKESNSKIIGPPSVAYPLLAENNVPVEQLAVFYPPQPAEYDETTIGKVNIKIFQTSHFNNWNPIHVSFLMEYEKTKLFIAGDSYSYLTDGFLKDTIDVLLLNMVEGNKNANNYITKYRQVDSLISFKYLLASHLINCDFTISPSLLKKEGANLGLSKLIVLEDEYDVFIFE